MSYCKSGKNFFPGSAGCQRCDARRLEALVKKTGDWTQGFGGMVVCATCGNKRCPKATFHGNKCTGSNKPNQPGSSYQICKCDWTGVDPLSRLEDDAAPTACHPDCTVPGHR